MQESLNPLRCAVTRLIGAPHPEQLFSALTATVKLARVYPVLLSGDAAELNVLVDLAVRDPRAYQRVLKLVDARRKTAHMETLNDGFDRVEYMREFMASKRARLVRAAELENRQRPARDRLMGRARLDFMDRTAAEWKRELDGLFAKARHAQGQRLTRDVVDTIRAQFWASVDKRLDILASAPRQRGL